MEHEMDLLNRRFHDKGVLWKYHYNTLLTFGGNDYYSDYKYEIQVEISQIMVCPAREGGEGRGGREGEREKREARREESSIHK
jgi:hypothetical protein